MSKNVFHASIEGAQHGAKTLDEFVNFAKTAGASGAEPSNYHIEDGNGGFKKAKEISDIFDKHGFKYHGLLMGKPRGGNYIWIDNLDVKGIKYDKTGTN